MRTRRAAGFNLIELMVAIAIIALLTSAVAIYAMKQKTDAEVATARNDLRVILDAMELYRVKHGRYPDPSRPLPEQRKQLGLKHVKDPWGRPYRYELEGGEPEISTLGADGEQGGEDENADLSSTLNAEP